MERSDSRSVLWILAVAALAEDIDGDGVPEVFLARIDGFVNVLRLADGRHRDC